jgi:putative inorganic carbon (HCO3(-)) transporter
MHALRRIFLSAQGFLLFFLFNPFLLRALIQNETTYDVQRILEWGVCLFAFAHLLFDNGLRQQLLVIYQGLVSAKKIFLAGILLLGILSSVHALYPAYALLEVATFFSLGMWALYLAACMSLMPALMLRALVFFVLFTFGINIFEAFLLMFQFHLHPVLLSLPDEMRLSLLSSDGYLNRRFFDDVACMLLPILVMLALVTSIPRFVRILAALLFCYSVSRACIGGSRVYVYETLALFIFLPLIFRKTSWRFLIFGFGGMIVGILLYIMLTQHISVPIERGLVALNHRGVLWVIAMHLIITHPLLGVGPLHYAVYAYSFEESANYAAHPHSALLGLAAEWGLPVVFLVLAIAVQSVIAWVNYVRRPCSYAEQLINIGLTAAAIGALLMMQVDGLIFMPPGQVALMLLLGTMLGRYANQAPKITMQALPHCASPVLLILNFIALAGLLWVGVPLFLQMPQLVLFFLEQHHFAVLISPNYWSQGFIQFY